MSAARLGRNWADVDEEDEDDVIADNTGIKGRCFETAADENGIKTVVEYKERDGKTYKVTKRVRQTTVTKWTNPQMLERKSMAKFGKTKGADAASEAMHITKSVEEVPIELCKKIIVLSQANDAEDKFYEEALKNCENLFKEKKVWTDANRDKLDAPPADTVQSAMANPAAGVAPAAGASAGGPAKYVPPSVRAGMAGSDGKGKGKGDGKGGEEASLRITNLSEDVREGDLQDLFSQFGRLQRVYLAKDMDTGLSKGFAFVTYYTKEDGQRAINKLHGHGYDNLILQVMWAKPKA
jgi:translation initiation factor 3 subunit G